MRHFLTLAPPSTQHSLLPSSHQIGGSRTNPICRLLCPSFSPAWGYLKELDEGLVFVSMTRDVGGRAAGTACKSYKGMTNPQLPEEILVEAHNRPSEAQERNCGETGKVGQKQPRRISR